MLDFFCIGSAELFGTQRERKIKNKNMSQAGIEPMHDTPRQVGTSGHFFSFQQVEIFFH